MSKISLPELKKQLKTYKPEELVSIIVDCYKSSEDVKKYIHMMLDPEHTENQLFEAAEKKILIQFYPDRGEPKLKFADARKAISEFSKLTNNQVRTIELMIYYVELGVQMTNDYGDMYESFYNSMVSMYQSAVQKIATDDSGALHRMFREKLIFIMQRAGNVGWGFQEGLADAYYTYVGGFDDED
ncbi:DUF6155 family protein [Paenibacillus oryzisoli]|uniref:Uncharacterized protein n=1 Tax=Paenibacillus oryzisoli TaxID=1850517 RepID=A0A197ZVT8_9BACL|nr:DUF6155 family protein [Paenibacillus oryzisoli]OAS13324.1 hypothetical protein A8708_15800 [Paenibacillus oryzisoli]